MKAARLAPWIVIAFLLVPGLLFPSRTPDWPTWIVGAELSGSTEPGKAERLYSLDESQKITRAFAQPQNGVWAFVRIPLYATLLRPLAWTSPARALVALVLNLLAIGAAGWLLWPSPWTPLVVVLFPPIIANFKQGQDAPLFVLAVAASTALLDRYPVLAGLILAFLGIKFNLLLLLPVFFVMKGAWRMVAGFAAGILLLISACFALYGESWPLLYYRLILDNERHLSAHYWSVGRIAASAVLAMGLVVLMVRIKPLAASLLVAVAVSALAGMRYRYDLVLILPLVLILLRGAAEMPGPVATLSA